MMLTPYTGFSPSLIQLDTPVDQYGPSLGRSDLLEAVEKHSCINPALPIYRVEDVWVSSAQEIMIFGERQTADRAAMMLHDCVCIAIEGGGQNLSFGDLVSFSGRYVTVWPSTKDIAGSWATGLEKKLREATAHVELLDLSAPFNIAVFGEEYVLTGRELMEVFEGALLN